MTAIVAATINPADHSAPHSLTKEQLETTRHKSNKRHSLKPIVMYGPRPSGSGIPAQLTGRPRLLHLSCLCLPILPPHSNHHGPWPCLQLSSTVQGPSLYVILLRPYNSASLHCRASYGTLRVALALLSGRIFSLLNPGSSILTMIRQQSWAVYRFAQLLLT